MLKTYRYRLYPNAAQATLLAQHFGHVRYVYNWALRFKKKYYSLYGKTLSRRSLQDRLVKRKRMDKYQWLSEVNSQSLLCALYHLDDAYKNFLAGRAKFPRFKTRKSNWQSFQCPQHVSVDQENAWINLPKIKSIKAIIHRGFTGQIKTCTIKKNPSGHYYISILVEDNMPLPIVATITEQKAIGVDVGLKEFVITSEGKKYDNQRYLQQSLSALNRSQRQLSRKQKGSANRSKQRLVVAKRHDKITKQRNFYHHHVANQLLGDNQVATVAVEDLHIKGMIRNRKLSRHIADVAWSRFLDIVSYKAKWQGKHVIHCGRYQPSSKQCSCGVINDGLTLKHREWDCLSCGQHHDRDILAANNIKKFAIADALGQSVCVKQFPHSDRSSKSTMAKDQDSQILMGRKKPPLEQLAV